MVPVKRLLATLTVTVVLAMNIKHGGYERYWWWDNTTHFLSGFALGLLLPSGREREYFLVIATIWEVFEWKLASLKLYETFGSLPEGPRSLGYEEWTVDHQVEDTILDTVMGLYGVRVARALKS